MNNAFTLDRRQVRRAFGRAAPSYGKHDVLQREVQQELLARLDFYLDKPARVLDVGAGTGRGTALLKKRFGKAEVIALDLSVAMLRQSRHHRKLLRPFGCVAGDATHLPVADHCVDVLHSNLCFQWCENLDVLFNECMRVLKPGGFLVFSTFGPDTLRELRSAWAGSDTSAHVSRFLDMHDIGDAMLRAGLRDPVLDVSRYTLTYETPRGLLRELKGLGATNADTTRRRGLTGKARYRQMLEAYETLRTDGRIPATWEVVTAHAWGPQPGQPRRLPGGGDMAAFSVDQLRHSRR